MSMLCFDLWLSTGERGYLEASIRYNDDDCRATKVVKEWLVEAVDACPGLPAKDCRFTLDAALSCPP